MTAIFNLLNRMGFAEAVINESDKDGPEVWFLALLSAISAVLTLLGGKFFKRSAAQRYVELSFRYKGRDTSLRAFVDTGNKLCDPISGRACIVVDVSEMKNKLPQRLLSLVLEKNVSHLAMLDEEFAKDVRLIPARAATGSGILFALRPDAVYIDTGKSKYEVDAMIALGDLGSHGGSERALVPSELVR